MLELSVPGQGGQRVAAVGGALAMPRVHVPGGDAEQPCPSAAPARVERAQRAERLDERLRGEIGDRLGLSAPPAKNR